MDPQTLQSTLRELNPTERETFRERERARCRKSLFYLARTVLGFSKLTSHLHLSVCNFIQNPLHKRKLLILPRGHFKSSCGTLSYPIWLFIQPDLSKIPITSDWSDEEVAPLSEDPTLVGLSGNNLTVLLANETATGAQHFLSWIETTFETNALFRFLFWEIIPEVGKRYKRWNQEEMLLPREVVKPEASIETIGVGGAVQGRHYPVQLWDDLIGKNAMESDIIMSATEEWIEYADSLFVNPSRDTNLVVGTRWAKHDIYNTLIKDGRYTVFHKGAVEDGVPTFPEEFSMDFYDHISSRNPYYYRTQYQNDPKEAGSGDLDSGKLERYELFQNDHGDYFIKVESVEDDVPRKEVIPLKKCYGCMTLDPSREEHVRRGSRKAIMALARDHKGRTYVLEIWASRGSHDEMFDAAFRLHGKWGYSLGVETVAFQKFLLWAFRKEMRRRRRWIPIRELSTSTRKSKPERIRSNVQNDLNLGLIYIREGMMLLVESMDAFPEGRDTDVLDCLAYGMQMLPGEPLSGEDEKEWEDQERKDLEGRSALTGY